MHLPSAVTLFNGFGDKGPGVGSCTGVDAQKQLQAAVDELLTKREEDERGQTAWIAGLIARPMETGWRRVYSTGVPTTLPPPPFGQMPHKQLTMIRLSQGSGRTSNLSIRNILQQTSNTRFQARVVGVIAQARSGSGTGKVHSLVELFDVSTAATVV